ncbi:uncharacterized protein Z520_11648 [Fonsecaea multimorphosa CBS 102226]|uniref:Uncharacterized protein n=1 Tax=Fonsecaea multimorphosa CBS 102226 TaxID=1442371 RepID=A0A0D2JQ37_9EURO|nr:uncharacterized protein Z520_11648 [Fonsecaea multimorphosa CBS 102226]KIX92619.1 hypothetical protein Z520_11648 [Fonsecaea multimorphosa CBS 102226]OAL17922.1 hypothetical protein AYO22_11186 [Fonsecaea multimorphosa]
MGKPKGKGLKSATTDSPQDLYSESISVPRPASPLRAADGHNVDGWADEDIRTYNELLNERAKLEKEKNELEQKSSRHQTQRALLDENATALDKLFKSQLGGDFKFTGPGTCCLDLDAKGVERAEGSSCKHEICLRAKSKGISWMEMDTIKYYHARIMAEKSQRMQNALRKQRDVELVRVKKDDEEEAALRARRNAILDKATRSSLPPASTTKDDKGSSTLETSALDLLPMASKDFLLDPKNSAILEAAKENEHIVRRIRGRLDKIRHDVNAGRVSPADARVKLDQANSEMAEAERKNNEFRQMILDAEPALSQLHQHPTAAGTRTNTSTPASLTTVLQNTLASSNADAFSQALSVMKGFFSASDPHDVQTAITDLRSVLELNGPMSPVLQKSFKALEEMLAKPNAKGFTVDVTTGDGKTRTCNNVVEVMMNLRLKMQASENPSAAAEPDLNLDEDTIKANLECIKVEDAAKKDMQKMVEKMVGDTALNVTTALKKIKAKAILKSPIPPLSDIVLEDVINDILFQRSVNALVAEATKGASLAQLSGKVTSLVISTSRNRPGKYLASLSMTKDAIIKGKKVPPDVLLEAISKVEASMTQFVKAYGEKIKQIDAEEKANPNPPPKPDLPTKHLLEGTHVDKKAFELFKKFFRTPSANDTAALRARFCEYHHLHIEEGMWDMLHIVLNHQTSGKFWWANWEAEKKYCIENMQVAAATPTPKVADTVLQLQELGICPARAVIILTQRIALQMRQDSEAAKINVMALRDIYADCESLKHKEWARSFNFIGQTTADTFAMLMFELVGQVNFEIAIMAADFLAFICTFVLGSMDAIRAELNLRYLEQFILSTLMESRTPINKCREMFSHYVHMCQDSSRYRCSPDHRCQATFSRFVTEKFASLVPAPLKVNKKAKENPEKAASSSTKAGAGPPRHVHIRVTVNAYWDVAKSLTPHLKCIEGNKKKKKKCSCSRADQEFAENIQVLKHALDINLAELETMIKKGLKPPQELWDVLEENAMALHERPVTYEGNQRRIAELRAKVGTGRFAEIPPAPPSEPVTKDSTGTQRQLSLKSVPVSVPSIQNSLSSNASEKGNLEKDATEGYPGHHNETSFSSEPGAVLAETKSTSTADQDDESDWHMTDRELEIRDQLLTFSDSVDMMHSFASVMHHGVNDLALDGVAWQIEDMLIGHVEMAWIIAKAQGYNGLQTWMEYYYAQTMPTPLGENFKVNGSGDYGNDASLADANARKKTIAFDIISKMGGAKGKPQAQITGNTLAEPANSAAANAATPAPSAVQQAEQAVADMERLGRNFLSQMQVVSNRRKRMPKRKW